MRFFRKLAPLFLAVFVSGCATFPWLDFPRRKPSFEEPALNLGKHDYTGIFHVHSRYSHDSKGKFNEIADAARSAGADFVVVADHNTLQGLRENMEGFYGKTLIMIGSEMSLKAGHLTVLGLDGELDRDGEPSQVAAQAREKGGLTFVSHGEAPRKAWNDWSIAPLTGLEVYNLAGDIYEDSRIWVGLKIFALPPRLFFKSVLDAPEKYLARWDDLLRTRKAVGVGAVDAHQKIRIFGRPLDGYTSMFKVAQTHVWAEKLTKKAVLDALAKGHAYVGFDLVAPVRDFVFLAESGGTRTLMGDEASYSSGLLLKVFLPKKGEIRLIKDGRVIQKAKSQYLEAEAPGPGVYRVEVYQGRKIWIISNPVYVKA